MLKVSFKKNSQKVQAFNGKATVVTMVGYMTVPNNLWAVFPDKVENWMWHHPSVDASWSHCKDEDVVRLEFSGKSVCAEGDIFNAEVGRRIAESRAMIKLYKFVYKLIKQLCDYNSKLLLGYADFHPAHNIDNSLYSDLSKYEALWIKESHHLGKLIEEA